ncbi:MAG: hypothetical protein MMC23_008877 [Stictis urceolatum]|nr:hypothetical protein [Stictis urceolata]
MQSARRSALRSAQRLRPRTQRRFESSHGEGHGHDAHHNAAPVNESISPKFLATLAALPVGYSIYTATAGDEQNPSALTRLIARYGEIQEDLVRRNAIHTKALEQAAFDRTLFHESEGAKNVNMKFPDQFNFGSPYSVHAGHQADLSAVIKHYKEQNRKMDEQIAARQTPKKSG